MTVASQQDKGQHRVGTRRAACDTALWGQALDRLQGPLTSNCGQFMDMPGPWLALNHLRSSTASAALMFCSRSR